MALQDDLARTLLVLIVQKRKKKYDRDCLGTSGDKRIGSICNRCFVERLQHLAGRANPFWHLVAHASRREKSRRFRIKREFIHLVPHLTPDLEHVTKSLSGDKTELGSLAL